MAYIGQGIKQGTFKVLDTSGNTYNGSNTTFNLGTQVGSAAQLLVSHDGGIQKAGTDYTLATGGTQITFSTAPASGASIFITEISGAVGGTVTPSDTSVTTDKLADSAVTTAKVADTAVTSSKLNSAILTGQTDIGAGIADADLFLVDDGAGGTLRKTAASRIKTYVGGFDVSSITGATALTEAPADTDEFVLSDAGTLKRVDFTHIKPGMTLLSMIDQDLGTGNKIQFQQVFSSGFDYYKVIGSFSLGSTGSHDIEFRWLNSSNAEQTASEYYGVAQGWRYNSGANDRSDWGQWQATGIDFARDVAGGAYYRKLVLEMDLHPDAYASTTYSAFQWSAGYFKYQGASESVSHITGYGAYAQTTDLSGGGFQLETNNNYDFVNMGVYGVKTTT